MIFQYPPVERIHYGENVVSEKLIEELQSLNVKQILIVTTNSMLNSSAYKAMVASLQFNNFSTHVTISKQHVPEEILMKDLKLIKEFNPHVIISCGGGSPIDAAKIISFILSENIQSSSDLYLYSENIRKKKITMNSFIYHFAIPTTLSASEFTGIAGVTNDEDHLKYKFSHINMTPKQVFLDPTFTLDTPEWLWLSTAIRAVDHAVETLYSPIPNPINTSLALQALKKLYVYLPLTKEHPSNLEYRLQCQIGSWLSLFSVSNIKLGLSHSIGHQLGALYNIPHGITSAIMLPHVMNLLLPQTLNEQYQITETLGQATGILNRDAQMAPQLIRQFIKDLGIPHRLRDFNVPKESLQTVVNNILSDIQGEQNSFVLNIVNIEKEIVALLEAAW